MSEKAVIQVRNVKKDFYLPHHKSGSIKQSIVQVFQSKKKGGENFHALRGVSFDVKDGEFLGIVGRNGSGKSTLLKILSNIYTPTSGQVKHNGKLVPFIELGVGFKQELTGRENVYLNGALLGFSKKEIDERYDEIVAFSELEEFMDQKLKNYSSGMKVRLAFSVATHADADILLLDEVLAVGDASFQRKCYEYFYSLKEQKKTIVFVSHNMGAVREYCDRAILIKEGKVAYEGDPQEVADEYLRMFNPKKIEEDKNAKEKDEKSKERWGSGELQIETVDVSVDKKKVVIKANVINNDSDINDVVMGLDIFDHNKKLACGTESHRYKDGFISFAKGERKTIEFAFDNVFGGGDYAVTLSVKRDEGNTIFDFWRNAAKFSNTVEENTYFPIIPPGKFTVKN